MTHKVVRRRHDADPDRHVACLTLILTAIVTWNTRYIQAALEHLGGYSQDTPETANRARLMPLTANCGLASSGVAARR